MRRRRRRARVAPVSERSCPNCGAALPPILRHARMVNCDYCESSVVVADEATRLAGAAGVMHDVPELIGLGRAVQLGDLGVFEATGHVRYDYGRGHWDEYHGATLGGDLLWVSVDEGDVAVQLPLPPADRPRGDAFRLGAEVVIRSMPFHVTEVETATLVAFRGQLPEPVAVGETHLYANLSGPDARIVSAERWDGGEAWFEGRWIDPFRVVPA